MRLWSLHPAYLDARGLGALWREGLLAQAVLRGKTRGYRSHPQLERWRARDPREMTDGTPLPENVTGDAGKLSQVLMNIISNGVKYTYSDKAVSVNVSYADDVLKVDVIDEGVGIAPENIEKVFDEFEQIENPLSDRTEGTGLGLAIVKRLIELLNGTITVESCLGEGSKFSMCFPLPNAKNK